MYGTPTLGPIVAGKLRFVAGIGVETLQARLVRLAAAAERSAQTANDDIEAFHAVCDEARSAGHTYGWISAVIGKSRTQTFRIANALTGPRSRPQGEVTP